MDIDVLAVVETMVTEDRQAHVRDALRAALAKQSAEHGVDLRCELYHRVRCGADARGPRARGHGGVAIIVRADLPVSRWRRSGRAANVDSIEAEDTLMLAVHHCSGGAVAALISVAYFSPQLTPQQFAARLTALERDMARAPDNVKQLVATDCNVQLAGHL